MKSFHESGQKDMELQCVFKRWSTSMLCFCRERNHHSFLLDYGYLLNVYATQNKNNSFFSYGCLKLATHNHALINLIQFWS